ncbi:hypothetical protein, partial [Pantoea agglomerans]
RREPGWPGITGISCMCINNISGDPSDRRVGIYAHRFNVRTYLYAHRFNPRTTKTKVYTAKLGVSAVDA